MTKLKKQDIELLTKIIKQWNSDRLDLFEISVPNEVGEFYGVMRFYFQEEGEKVATKCIRVTSTATATQVINTLIEKFRPDMKLLSRSRYSLYEVHINGEEKKIEDDEKPLLVQLNWNKDDREGRFLLKRENEKSKTGPGDTFYRDTKEKVKQLAPPSSNTFKRRLSSSSSKRKTEKKESKKQDGSRRKEVDPNPSAQHPTSGVNRSSADQDNGGGVGDQLYAAVPETCFTRSISNPEAVMRRRRAQKLEKKLRAINNGAVLNGSVNGYLPCPDKGGTLKIYGESLQAGVPYKTLLLAVTDTASYVVRETLIKYGLTDVDPSEFSLYEVHCAGGGSMDPTDIGQGNVVKEYVLGDGESPISRLMQCQQSKDEVIFRIGPKPAKNGMLRHHSGSNPLSLETASPHSSPAKSFTSSHLSGSVIGGSTQRLNQSLNPALLRANGPVRLNESTVVYESDSTFFDQTLTNASLIYAPNHTTVQPVAKEDSYPFFIELHNDGRDITERSPMVHHLASNVIEIGSETPIDSGSLYLQLKGRDIFPKHCILTRTTHNVSLTPCRSEAAIWMDDKPVREITVLKHGSIVRFGSSHTFKFFDPLTADSTNKDRKFSSSSLLNEQHRIPNRLEETHLDEQPTFKGNSASPNYVLSSKLENQNFIEFVRKNETLPAFLDILLKKGEEDVLVNAILPLEQIKQIHISLPFKLAPAYMVYLCTRYCTLRDAYASPQTAAPSLELILNKVVGHLRTLIEAYRSDPVALTFWLTNGSEIWYAVRKESSSYAPRAYALELENSLGQCTYACFSHLTARLRADLSTVLSNLFQPPPLQSVNQSTNVNSFEDVVARPCAPLIKTLTSLMNMLKQHRLNASLTIQIFSRLFYFVNSWTFNAIFNGLPGDLAQGVGPVLEPLRDRAGPNPNPPYSREWGSLLRARFGELERWSEMNGLELAAECHLAKIVQLLQLLIMPKAGLQDIPQITSACSRLNSLQFYTILTNYRHGPGEATIPNDLIERVVSIAHNTTDEAMRSSEHGATGVKLEESLDLTTPFVFPEDGYSYDVIKNVPSTLLDSIKITLTDKALANLIVLPSQYGGAWNVHFKAPTQSMQPNQPPPHRESPPANFPNKNGPEPRAFEVPLTTNMGNHGNESNGPHGLPVPKNVTITKSERGLGLSIVAARLSTSIASSPPNEALGIYVKAVVKGGAAELAGAPRPGDHLLAVNGISLIGLDEGAAARLMGQAGPLVTLTYVLTTGPFTMSGNSSPDYCDNYSVVGSGGAKPDQAVMSEQNSHSDHRGRVVFPPHPNLDYAHQDKAKYNSSYGSQSYVGPMSQPPAYPSHHVNAAHGPQPAPSRVSPNNYRSSKIALDPHGNLIRGPSPLSQPAAVVDLGSDHKKDVRENWAGFNRSNQTAPLSNGKNRGDNLRAENHGSSYTDLYRMKGNQYAPSDNSGSPLPPLTQFNGASKINEGPFNGGTRFVERKFEPSLHSTLPPMRQQAYSTREMGEPYTANQYGQSVNERSYRSDKPPSPLLDMGSNSSDRSPPQIIDDLAYGRHKNLHGADLSNGRLALEADLYMGQAAKGLANSSLAYCGENLYSSVNKAPQPAKGDGFDIRFPRLDKGLSEPVDIGPREKIALCQDMMAELEAKQFQTQEDKDRMKALVMEYEFQKRVLEDEEANQRDMSEDEEVSPTSPSKLFDNPAAPMNHGQNDLPIKQALPPISLSHTTNGYFYNGSDLHHDVLPVRNGSFSPAFATKDQKYSSNQVVYGESNTKIEDYHEGVNGQQHYQYTQHMAADPMEAKPKPPDRSLASFEATSISRMRQPRWEDTSSENEHHIAQQQQHHHQPAAYAPDNGFCNRYELYSETLDRQTNGGNLPPPFASQHVSGGGCERSQNQEAQKSAAPYHHHQEKYGFDQWLQSIDANMREDDDNGGNPNFHQPSMVVNTSATPGVIGAQEIYLDPRVKLQMLKKQQQKLRDDLNNITNYPIQSILKKPKEVKEVEYMSSNQHNDQYNGFKDNGYAAAINTKVSERQAEDQNPENSEKQGSPERMSFREKMKKFAQVSGSQNPDLSGPLESGMEKLRISKTQKKIEDSLLT